MLIMELILKLLQVIRFQAALELGQVSRRKKLTKLLALSRRTARALAKVHFLQSNLMTLATNFARQVTSSALLQVVRAEQVGLTLAL